MLNIRKSSGTAKTFFLFISECFKLYSRQKLSNVNGEKYWLLSTKEIVERRHGEPIKFLFLPKMGLFG